MKVTYLSHSGFLVELPHQLLLFDYYEFPLPTLPPKPLTVFISHSHSDHCNPAVFSLVHTHPAPVKILHSRDVRLTPKRCQAWNIDETILAACTAIYPDREYAWEDMSVQSIRSTDLGVAFAVQTEGYSLYHAGDLNWWYWEAESDDWNDRMATRYQAALQKLQGKHFHCAFVPVDSRLGEHASYGADALLQAVKIDWLFPMHFWGDFAQTEAYRKHCAIPCVQVVPIHECGESWELAIGE